MFRIALCLLVLLTACGRSVTERERMFLGDIHGDSLDYARLRIVEGAPYAPSPSNVRPARAPPAANGSFRRNPLARL